MRSPLFINRRSVSASLSLATTLVAASPSFAAEWQNNVSYGGSGPTMDLYVPDTVDASPGILVALHYCSGNSGATHGWFQSLADQHGFIVISPSVGGGKNCWDATPPRRAAPATTAGSPPAAASPAPDPDRSEPWRLPRSERQRCSAGVAARAPAERERPSHSAALESALPASAVTAACSASLVTDIRHPL
ncbi:hypothetical protein WMF04_17555 [Sorangium sp. So ce260]